MALRSAERAPLVHQVIDQLRAQIAAGEWPVGSRIPPEPELVAQLGVGRNTVREAVKALVHSGLLDSRQGSGTYVRAASELSGAVARRVADARARDVLEVRRAFEVAGARLAAARRTDADLAAMDALLNRRDAAWRAGDAAGFVAADADLHLAVVEAAHNPVLAELYADFGTAMRANLADHVGDSLTDHTFVDHAGLVAAIRLGDPEAAAREAVFFLDETLAVLA